MSLIVDLHSHSTASDGTLSPTDLVNQASTAGVDMLALTDHDTTTGIVEAVMTADPLDLMLIPGIEVSVTWNAHVVHIVGLGIDIENRQLQEGLKALCEFRDWRAVQIGDRLAQAGIEGAYEGAKALSNGRLISRSHFARFLVEKGHAPDVRRVFKRFLTHGKPGHVAGRWASLEDAVTWIHGAGGQAVIAHPARYPFTRTKLRRLIAEFKEIGGEALEVVSGSQSSDENQTMARHARDFELLGSAGSDYHGPESPWTGLGRVSPMPDGVTPIWQSWQDQPQIQSA